MSVGRGVIWKKHRVERARCLDMVHFTRKADLRLPLTGTASWTTGHGQNATIGWQVQPPGRLRLCYTVTKPDGQKIDYDYWIALDTTPCNYGGKRWWFICPNAYCGRRCRILYLASGSEYFLCRICLNLTYQSQQEGLTKASAFFKLLNEGSELEARLMTGRDKRRRLKDSRRLQRLLTKAGPMLTPVRNR